MTMKLFLSAIGKFLLGVLLVAVLIFLPAGTLRFANGLLLMTVLFLPMLMAGIALIIRNPALLQKRLKAKEKNADQDLVVKLSGLMFIGSFTIAGLGYRFHWYRLPWTVSVIATVIFLLGYLLYAEVLRENAYLSRTIEVQEGQTVVDTGLYGIVRHPMYGATLLLFLSMPLILGSIDSFAVALVYPLLIVKRIKGEEALLEEQLQGYREYKKKVKYRLIPFIW